MEAIKFDDILVNLYKLYRKEIKQTRNMGQLDKFDKNSTK